MAQGTWRRLVLLSIWAAVLLVHIQYVTTEVRLPCGMVKDWFPSDVKPQISKAPYVLDVIRPDGKSVFDMFSGEPHYGPGEELTYTSEIIFILNLFLRQLCSFVYFMTKRITTYDWVENRPSYCQILICTAVQINASALLIFAVIA